MFLWFYLPKKQMLVNWLLSLNSFLLCKIFLKTQFFRMQEDEKNYISIHEGDHPSVNVGYHTGETIMTINSFDYADILHLFFHSFGIVHNNQPKEFIESQYKRCCAIRLQGTFSLLSFKERSVKSYFQREISEKLFSKKLQSKTLLVDVSIKSFFFNFLPFPKSFNIKRK